MGPSEIPRYTLTTHPSGHVDMVPDPKGKWVKFDDAAMEVLMVGADVERHFRSDPYRWERELTLLQAKTGEDD